MVRFRRFAFFSVFAFGMIGATGAVFANDANNVPAAGRAEAVAPAAVPKCGGCFAIIRPDGSLAGGKLVLSTLRIGTGTYDIRFKRRVVGCAYTANVGLPGNIGASAPGFTTVVGRAGTNNGVFLQTFAPSGGESDLGFHLVITC